VQKIEMDNILTHEPLHIIYATGLFSCPKREGLRVHQTHLYALRAKLWLVIIRLVQTVQPISASLIYAYLQPKTQKCTGEQAKKHRYFFALRRKFLLKGHTDTLFQGIFTVNRSQAIHSDTAWQNKMDGGFP